MENTRKIPENIISIPTIDNYELFERNVHNAERRDLEHCPCCGKAITNPRYFINSIYGGNAYKADDKNEYADAWVMGVGTECRKKFPEGYVFEQEDEIEIELEIEI